MSETEHECNSCAFGRPIYDNFEDIMEYECPNDYEVNSDECNSIYVDGDEII